MVSTTQRPVKHRTEHGIVIIEIDRPPVNALAHPGRMALLQAIIETDADLDVKAMVVHGVGRHLIPGSDLHEFAADPLEPLPNVRLATHDWTPSEQLRELAAPGQAFAEADAGASRQHSR
jgi:enoyl-CoA hydratase/carnithine racemase